jgi:putative nucleotidyltransferase with HDIG domain
MRKEDVPFYTRLLDLVKHERRIFRDEIGVLIHRDGSYRYFSISSAPNLDAEDKVIGFVGIFKDITDLKLSQEELKKSYQKLQGTLDVTIQAISMIVEARDPYTSGHQVRVAKLSSAIARELGLSEDHIRGIRMAALIHDIGKINVPAEILSKPTRLNDIELSMVRAHPQVGYNILKTIDFPFPVEKVVLQHHERLDGSGYPNGLSGDDIILEARILGVSDVVESMASHRPYRPAMGIEAALARIRQEKGTCFDPSVVDACVDLFQNKGFKF